MTKLTQADYENAIESHNHAYTEQDGIEWFQENENVILSALCLAARVPDAFAASGKPMPQTMDAPDCRNQACQSVGCSAPGNDAASGASFDCGELDVALEWYAARQEMKPSPYLETLANAAKLYRTQVTITDDWESVKTYPYDTKEIK